MIIQSVQIVFLGDRIGVQSYSFDGGLGVANGWVETVSASVDAAELGAVIRSGLAHSEQDYQAPVITRDRTGSPVAQALGLASFDAMIRAGALAVTVFRRNEWLKVESTTTDRTAFAVQPSNWTTTLPADSDATTVGEAVLEARSHSTVDFSR